MSPPAFDGAWPATSCRMVWFRKDKENKSLLAAKSILMRPNKIVIQRAFKLAYFSVLVPKGC